MVTGVTAAGPGVTAASVNSLDVLFPLRLGMACSLQVSLASVRVVDVTSVSSGVVGLMYTCSATDPVNTKSAPCPSLRRLSARGTADPPFRALRDPASRIAYVVTSGTAPNNGTYIVVRLSVSVTVPAATLATAGGNVSSIASVAAVVSAVARLTGAGNASSSAAAAVQAAFGPFVGALAAAVGVNDSALAVGFAGPPVAATAASSPAQLTDSATPRGLAAGTIAGIAILLILLCVAMVLAVIFLARRRSAAKSAVASPQLSAVAPPTHLNPLFVEKEAPGSDAKSVAGSAVVVATPRVGDHHLRAKPLSDAVPTTSNPLLAKKEPIDPSTADSLAAAAASPRATALAAPPRAKSQSDALPRTSNPLLAHREARLASNVEPRGSFARVTAKPAEVGGACAPGVVVPVADVPAYVPELPRARPATTRGARGARNRSRATPGNEAHRDPGSDATSAVVAVAELIPAGDGTDRRD